MLNQSLVRSVDWSISSSCSHSYWTPLDHVSCWTSFNSVYGGIICTTFLGSESWNLVDDDFLEYGVVSCFWNCWIFSSFLSLNFSLIGRFGLIFTLEVWNVGLICLSWLKVHRVWGIFFNHWSFPIKENSFTWCLGICFLGSDLVVILPRNSCGTIFFIQLAEISVVSKYQWWIWRRNQGIPVFCKHFCW